jgi:hypothetical protein
MTLIKRILVSVIVAACLLLVANKVRADDLPPYLRMDENGNITFDPSGLTLGDPITLPPPEGWPWFESGIPGTDLSVCVGCLGFNSYTTPNGATVVVPNGYTAIVMALTGQNPFTSEPDVVIGNGIIAAAVAAGVFDQMGLAPDLVTPESVLQALQSMDPLFFLQLNLALNDPNSPLFSGLFLYASGLFVFECHPVTGECPPILSQPPDIGGVYEAICQSLGDCRPIGQCPDRNWVISQLDPTYSAGKLAPPFPVVVGQDAARRGVDVQASVTSHPVYVTYTYEHVTTGPAMCRWLGGGQGGGCGAGWTGPVDWQDGWQPFMASDPDWGVRSDEVRECRRHTDTFLDRIGTLVVRANLSDASVAWITGELAGRYPGARVYQPNWLLYPGRPAASGGFSADRTSFSATYARLPMADPGEYLMTITGRTLGTPYTQPRTLFYEQPAFAVDAAFQALTK